MRSAAITPRFIYANPTINKLARELNQYVLSGSSESSVLMTVPAEQEMAEIVKKYRRSARNI